eukprot:SAG31_NODE_1454_length_8278_cov_7.030688_7_plen_861_part_00
MIAAAAFLLCTGGSEALEVDIKDLKSLDVPEGLQQFLEAMVVTMQGMETENAALINRTQTFEAELSEARTKIDWLKSDRDAFENAIRMAERKHQEEITCFKNGLAALQNKTKTLERELFEETKKRKQLSIDVTEVRNVLDRFSNKANEDYTNADTSPFISKMEWRRTQTDACVGHALVARVQQIHAACCSSGGRHRLLQAEDGNIGSCSHLPTQCTLACAPVFIAFREDCDVTMEEAGFDMQQVERLHNHCLELVSVDEGSCSAQIGRRILQRVESSQDTVAQSGATTAMIIPLTIIRDDMGNLMALSSAGRRQLQQHAAEIVQEFRCACGTEITSCLPTCGEALHGFELLVTVDETDLRMSCKLNRGIFSWAGAVSEGSYFGADHELFLNVLISGSAGHFTLNLMVNADVHDDTIVRRNQIVQISGRPGMRTPWGSGSITIGEDGILTMIYMRLDGAFIVEPGGAATVKSSTLAGDIEICANGAEIRLEDCEMSAEAALSQSQRRHQLVATGGGTIILARLDLSMSTVANTLSQMGESHMVGTIEFINVRLSTHIATDRESIAAGRPTTSSSVGWGGEPQLAVDGTTNGFYFEQHSCTHSDDGEPNPWWQVDLGSMQTVGFVDVYNRVDPCCDYFLVGAHVVVSSTAQFRDADACGTLTQAAAQPERVACDASGRFVTIVVKNGRLTVCEVKVFPTEFAAGDRSGYITLPSNTYGIHYDLETQGLLYAGGTFRVMSGPCTVWSSWDNGTATTPNNCVGRRHGYLGSEKCNIMVVGSGVLGPCPFFDTHGRADFVNVSSQMFFANTCPIGTSLADGDSIEWTSDSSCNGGNHGGPGGYWLNAHSADSQWHVGGGWALCFA